VLRDKKRRQLKASYNGPVNVKKKGPNAGPPCNYIDESDDDVETLPDAERVANESIGYEPSYQMLEKLLLDKLRSCQKCGKAKLCLVDKDGAHQDINYNQLRTWVCAMVSLSIFVYIY
jgi:hypothetical protein